MNNVSLIGRLTHEPELRTGSMNNLVLRFTIAINNGNETTNFIPIIVFNEQAENVASYLHKGSLIGVVGRLNQRIYQNQDGKNVNVIEIVAYSVQFLEPKKKVDE